MTFDTSLPDPAVDPATRCFGGDSPLYQAYHDWEWGEPVHGDTALFERLSLEALAAGLSWFIVLRKRDSIRAGFAGFDPAAVAAFGEADVDRLMADPGQIRNRPKIEAIIANARALLAFQAAGGSLDALVWGHATAPRRPPRTIADIPSGSPEAHALTSELKAIGFRWVGPTIAHSTLEAVGVVNDHVAGCPRAAPVTEA
ncbi:MAG: DNA-3-methyladenine glycosylase I [Propionibacteriaceae bacterium]|nr:DNA-3-methyladenine glycosylase I [Propionibacteriaceae bacterium]